MVTEQSFLYSKWFLESLKIAKWFSLGGGSSVDTGDVHKTIGFVSIKRTKSMSRY